MRRALVLALAAGAAGWLAGDRSWRRRREADLERLLATMGTTADLLREREAPLVAKVQAAQARQAPAWDALVRLAERGEVQWRDPDPYRGQIGDPFGLPVPAEYADLLRRARTSYTSEHVQTTEQAASEAQRTLRRVQVSEPRRWGKTAAQDTIGQQHARAARDAHEAHLAETAEAHDWREVNGRWHTSEGADVTDLLERIRQTALDREAGTFGVHLWPWGGPGEVPEPGPFAGDELGAGDPFLRDRDVPPEPEPVTEDDVAEAAAELDAVASEDDERAQDTLVDAYGGADDDEPITDTRYPGRAGG